MKKHMMKHTMILAAAAALFTGCEKSADSFSLMADSASFKQSAGYSQRKIDILWVVDNSGSMATSQQNLANSFQSFISRFSQLGYDFHMGVTSTDAYLDIYYNDLTRSRLKDGGSTHSGIRVMDKNTSNLSNVFLTNVKLGTSGSGDERAFSSFESTLKNVTYNSAFRRPDAFLQVIIVSDEDDFSHNDTGNGTNNYYFTENYNDPKIYPISRFTSMLDTMTNTVAGGVKNYAVSAIAVQDTACKTQLSADGAPDRKVNVRYKALVDATGGTNGSLCSDFGTTLSTITDQIIELSSTFKLDRQPKPETISVVVDGSVIPQNSTNGWTYDASNWSITFHGSSVPAANSNVKVNFDPMSALN